MHYDFETALIHELIKSKRLKTLIRDYAKRLHESGENTNAGDFRYELNRQIEEIFNAIDERHIAYKLMRDFEGDIEMELEEIKQNDPEWLQGQAEYYAELHADDLRIQRSIPCKN